MAARLTEYHSLADVYEFLTPEALLTPEGNVAAFAPWLPRPPARVLDCACGIGLLAAGLARAGYDAHASDISPEMVGAHPRAGRATRACATGSELPPSGDFDAVLCVGNSLPHTPDRRGALAAMAGALRARRRAAPHLAQLGARAAGRDARRSQRGGRRLRITRVWTPGPPDPPRSSPSARSPRS